MYLVKRATNEDWQSVILYETLDSNLPSLSIISNQNYKNIKFDKNFSTVFFCLISIKTTQSKYQR